MGDAFKALADPSRRRILELLSEGDLSAGEIAAHFDMAKPSVSHHLSILRDAGLSLKTKGLFAIILSLPEDWDYSVAGLATVAGCGRDAIRQ